MTTFDDALAGYEYNLARQWDDEQEDGEAYVQWCEDNNLDPDDPNWESFIDHMEFQRELGEEYRAEMAADDREWELNR